MTYFVPTCPWIPLFSNIGQSIKCKLESTEIKRSVSKKLDLSSVRKKCPYSEFFWSVFSSILTEYGDLRSKSSYSVQMRKNTDQKDSEYGRFSRSGYYD